MCGKPAYNADLKNGMRRVDNIIGVVTEMGSTSCLGNP